MFAKKAYLLLFLLIPICAILFFSQTAQAANNHILINEIYPHPLSGESEWIELYNPSAVALSLAKCTIEDGTHHPKALDTYPDIGPSQYLVLEGGTDFSFGLNNDADEVSLFCNGLLIDDIKYGDTSTDPARAKSPLSAKSLTRFSSDDTDNWATDFIMALPTKGSAYVKPIFSTSLRINELLPQPSSGGEEFVELYNEGISSVDLSGWTLRDRGGTAYNFVSGTSIDPSSYLVVYQSQTHIYQNNDGDSISLLDPNGDLVSEKEYDKATESLSFSYFPDGWKWTESQTPGSENIFTLTVSGGSQPKTATSIAEAKKLPIGTTLIVRGTVTALPGALSSQYFYIQDASGGIQIYCYYKDFPGLNQGDVVEISGELSLISGEFRIKIGNKNDITIISSGVLPPPQVIDPGGALSAIVGQYVEISGVVESPSGTTFYVRGKTGRIKVQIRNSDLVKKPKLKSGDQVQVKGVLSVYNESYRILPYESGSVKILKTGTTLPNSGAESLIYPVLSVLTLLLWKLLPRLRLRLRI